MELRSFVFVAISCIGGNLLDVSADNSRIYGGYPINITDAPYMVHVVYANTIFANGSALTNTCGGSILRKNLILTAGHCVQATDGSMETHDAKRFIIFVGSTLKYGGQVYNVSNVYPHPKFQGGANRRHHDIGLLELTSDIPMSPTSQHVKLVHKNDQIKAGDDGVVSGWGHNPDNPNDPRLYQVHLPVISPQECARLNDQDTAQGYEQHEICTNKPGKSFCSGDSGGPYIDTKTGRQTGVVSYGAADCTEDLPSIFSKVQDNMDFINEIIKKTRKSRAKK